jgi:hypothetical protein
LFHNESRCLQHAAALEQGYFRPFPLKRSWNVCRDAMSLDILSRAEGA